MKKAAILSFLTLASALTAKPSIDLSGEWRFALDAEDSGAATKFEDLKFPDNILLPGSVSGQGSGEPKRAGFRRDHDHQTGQHVLTRLRLTF